MVIEINDQDVIWIEKRYSNLKFAKNEGLIKGRIDFVREYNKKKIEDFYEIEIILQSNIGSIIPSVRETGGKMFEISKDLKKRLSDIHINLNQTLCLCIDEEERDYFSEGVFNWPEFFRNILEPRLFWASYFRKYKTPPWGEYAHEELGYLEKYAEGSLSIKRLRELVSSERLCKVRKMKGHSCCPCESHKRVRDCHALIFRAIYKLKEEYYG